MLQIRNLTKIYKAKSGVEVKAVDNLSVDFPQKGMVFLLGKSGSGKSTLLNLIGGLDEATSGEVIIKGKSSKTFKNSDFDSFRNTYIGFVFQEFNILEEYTVEKNIGLSLQLQGVKGNSKTIVDILKEVDLEGYNLRKPNELSGGQKQRIAIARALVKNPEIILADEPTGALDSHTGKQVFETLKKLSKDKLVIVVSHDRDNANLYADRIIELKDGYIMSDMEKTSSGELKDVPLLEINPALFIVKKGTKLSAEDRDRIVSFVENAQEDIVISCDKNINAPIEKEINDDLGYKSNKKFAEKNKDLITYEGEKAQFIKSKLPANVALKMGVSGLKYKKVRLLMTILLSFISFALLGVADMMAQYSTPRTDVMSAYSDNHEIIKIGKERGEKYPSETRIYWHSTSMGYYDLNPQTAISDNDLEMLESLTDSKLYPVYNKLNFYSLGLYNNVKTGYTDSIAGLIELENSQDEENLNLTLLAGEMPSLSNQIAITDYHAKSLIDFNYRSSTNRQIIIQDYNDIISKVKVNDNQNNQYNISGIYKTEIDIDKMIEKFGEKENIFTYTSLNSLTNDSIANVGFVKKNFHSELPLYINYSYNLAVENGVIAQYITNFQKVDNYDNIVFFDPEKETLGEYEIVVSSDNSFGISSSNKRVVLDRMGAYHWRDPQFIEYDFENSKFVIVGIMNSSNYDYNAIYLEEAGYSSLVKDNSYISGVMTKLNGNYFADYNLFNDLKSNEIFYGTQVYNDNFETSIYIRYRAATMITGSLEIIEDIAANIVKVFYIISLVFMVFSILLLANFIAISIANKKKDIGILRSIGARSLDVFKIFFSESIIIGLFTYIVAIIAIFIIAGLLNNAIGVTAVLMGFRQYALMLILTLVIVAVGTLLPVYKFARKKPIDAIKSI